MDLSVTAYVKITALTKEDSVYHRYALPRLTGVRIPNSCCRELPAYRGELGGGPWRVAPGQFMGVPL